jgi:tetratricopeptide (TPR) repeat protein/Mg-chelatase subunit ChlD
VAVGVAVLAASITALVLGRRAPPIAARSIEARLELAAGEVTLKQNNQWPTVVSGLPLPDGAELATGKGARALVRLSDGSAIFLRGDSQVALGRTGVDLGKGEIWLDAPASERGGLTHKLGEVTVTAADAGLSMRREGADVSVYVTRGLAVVSAPGGRVEVNAGEQATIAAGAPPKVASVKYWEDWTGGMGDHRPLVGAGSGSGSVYGVDRNALPGSPARTLEISRQVVRAVIRDGLAETEVDQTFGNPGGRELEGWYWFTVPERAVVTSFAVETDGQLVEGEVIERQEAVAKYQAAVRAAHEPALLEWIDGHSYRARIFPVPASGSRRVVLRYLELVGARAGRFEYVYPLRGSSTDAAAIGEFSLTVDLGDAGVGMPLATLADAVIEENGRMVTMRRSGFAPRADFQLEGSLRTESGPFRVARFAAGADRADYVMARYVPDVDWTSLKDQPGDLVVVVDTSASADESGRQQKAGAAEAVLRAMSPSDHFALVALDAAPRVLYPKEGLAEASEKEIAVALERLAEHASGGATDLGALFDVALGRVHGKDQPAVIYIGDGLATSGEVTGDKLAERLRRSLAASRARFFTVGVGPDANHALLGSLARAGGGQPFRIDDVAGATAEVLRLASAIKTPTITDLAIDLGAGLDEPMLTASGKVSRGEEVILLARTHHALPEKATVKGRLGGKDFERSYKIQAAKGIGTALVPRLWAAEKIRRLLGDAADQEEHRGKVVELGVEYGLVTPFTSILALESEYAYAQQGIKRRRSPLRGVKLSALTPAEERSIVATLAPPSPVLAMGCSKMSDDAPSAAAIDNKEGGYGTRAKGEEGAMGPRMAAATAAAASAAAPMPAPEPQAMDIPAQGGQEKAKGGFDAKPGRAPTAGRGPNRADTLADLAGSAAMNGAPPPPPVAAVPPGARGFGALNAPKPPARPANQPATAPFGVPATNAKLAVPVAPAKKADERPVKMPMAQCSDSARRPLAERIVIWQGRLRRASSVEDLIARYEGARTTCEIPDWRADAALLGLIQAKVRTEGAAEQLLAHFAGQRETQKFIAHAILRRSVDERVVAVVRRVLFEGGARWVDVDNELAALATPEDRVARLRQARLSYPDDPEGEIRLVRALAEAKQKDEALALGRRMRERGFMSPALSMALGDVLAEAGFDDDAVRAYSEIVEFDPGSAESRRLLGDVYLRHGWYPAAYRQYKTLADLAGAEPVSWLRLAAAAAGSGRVDEALRIDRQVAAAEGTPGPNDPRAWARLLSAARLGRLLAPESKPPAGQSESVSRKLKELGVLNGPGALQILTWEDHGAALSLAAMDGLKESTVGEATSALPVALTAVLLPAADLERLKWVVRWRNDPPGRGVSFVLHTLIWDGKSFKVSLQRGKLEAKDKEIAL